MKFMCKYSGSVYNFELEQDIKAMLSHPDYIKVEEEEVKEEVPAPKRGRPAKKSEEEADE
jgi:hypothetical protein